MSHMIICLHVGILGRLHSADVHDTLARFGAQQQTYLALSFASAGRSYEQDTHSHFEGMYMHTHTQHARTHARARAHTHTQSLVSCPLQGHNHAFK